MSTESKIIKSTLKKAVLKGANIIKNYFFSKKIKVDSKKWGEIVTDVDLKVQEAVIEILNSNCPEVLVISEERENLKIDSDEIFYLDPIDGTFNFSKGINIFCISIGYWKKQKPICGVVYNPISNDFFCAYKGEGAYRNNNLIVVSKENDLKNSLISSGWPYDKSKLSYINRQIFNFINFVGEIRFLGSAALAICYVASGILDGYWECDLYPWDIAAAIPIALEAGAKVSSIYNYNLVPIEDFRLEYKNELLITNKFIHDDIARLLVKKD